MHNEIIEEVKFANILQAAFPSIFFCQLLQLSREKLHKTLSYEKGASKMLVKLTTGCLLWRKITRNSDFRITWTSSLKWNRRESSRLISHGKWFQLKSMKRTSRFLISFIDFSDTCSQARIKGLVGPRHFVFFGEQTFFYALLSATVYILYFVGCFFLIFNLRRPLFSRRLWLIRPCPACSNPIKLFFLQIIIFPFSLLNLHVCYTMKKVIEN